MKKHNLFINTFYNNISKINNNNKIKTQINKNFIKNNENKNKSIKKISNLNNKDNNIKKEIQKIKNEIKNKKINFNETLKNFNEIKSIINKNEIEIEKNNLIINKLKTNKKILLTSIDSNFFKTFKYIFYENLDKFLSIIYYINFENYKIEQLKFLINNKNDLIMLLNNSHKKLSLLNKNEHNIYENKCNNIKRYFIKIDNENNKEINPINLIYKYIQNSLDIIKYKNIISTKYIEINKLILKKNEFYKNLKINEEYIENLEKDFNKLNEKLNINNKIKIFF